MSRSARCGAAGRVATAWGVGLTLAVALLLADTGCGEDSSDASRVSPGKAAASPAATGAAGTSPTVPAPSFELEDLGGKKVRLADYRGKVVLLDFWATWCGPCRMEIPHLLDLYAQYESKGFVVVGISLDRNAKSVVPPFVKKNKITYPVLLGKDDVARAYGGIRSIPTAFLIDKDGMVVKKYIGYQNKEVFRKDLLPLLSGA